jgi:hypothetical protein
MSVISDQASSAATLFRTVAALVDRTEVVDALYRFAAGQDLDDRALFESAFADDARLDFRQPARRLGVDVPVFAGRREIAEAVLGTLARLDTMHTVTNSRVTLAGDRATLFALVEAQHLLKENHGRRLLLKNVYWVDLTRSGDRWEIAHMRIENVWSDGDPAVLFPGATASLQQGRGTGTADGAG